MRARAFYVMCMVSGGVGLLFIGAGAIAHDFGHALAGGLLIVFAWGLRENLRRHGEWEAARGALDAMVHGAPSPAGGRVAHLLELMRQRDELESKRGLPDFDPWELLARRRAIQAFIGEDPGLVRLFESYERNKRMI
jgi:hypothetical protein